MYATLILSGRQYQGSMDYQVLTICDRFSNSLKFTGTALMTKILRLIIRKIALITFYHYVILMNLG